MVFYHSKKIYLLQHLKYKDGAIDIWKHVYSSSKKRLEEAADISTLREKIWLLKWDAILTFISICFRIINILS